MRLESEHFASPELAPVSDSSCDTHGRYDWHLSPDGQGLRLPQDDGGEDDLTRQELEPNPK